MQSLDNYHPLHDIRYVFEQVSHIALTFKHTVLVLSKALSEKIALNIILITLKTLAFHLPSSQRLLNV